MLPQDIAGERRCNGQEAVSTQCHHFPTLQVVEWSEIETLQRELLDSPLQPTQYVLLGPLARICNKGQGEKRIFMLIHFAIKTIPLGSSRNIPS